MRTIETMKITIFRTIVLMTLTIAISACGNKGDLYMPEKDKDTAKTVQPSK